MHDRKKGSAGRWYHISLYRKAMTVSCSDDLFKWKSCTVRMRSRSVVYRRISTEEKGDDCANINSGALRTELCLPVRVIRMPNLCFRCLA